MCKAFFWALEQLKVYVWVLVLDGNIVKSIVYQLDSGPYELQKGTFLFIRNENSLKTTMISNF